MSKFMTVVLMVSMLSASALMTSAASLAGPKRVAASVVAAFMGPEPLACTSGTAYAATCPESSGACTCIEFTGNATGGFGRGPVSGAITLDNFDATPESGCAPIFGSIAITNSRNSSIATLDINGTLCNATIPGGTRILEAGFDLDPAVVGLSGTGSISGTIDNTGRARLRLTGAIAPAATATVSATPSATPTM